MESTELLLWQWLLGWLEAASLAWHYWWGVLPRARVSNGRGSLGMLFLFLLFKTLPVW